MCDSGTADQKIKVAQLYLDGVPGYCVPMAVAGALIQDELESLEDGLLSVKIVEMTQEQFDNAPEFEGW